MRVMMPAAFFGERLIMMIPQTTAVTASERPEKNSNNLYKK